MCVRERFGDPFGVKQDRSEVFVNERRSAQNTWPLSSNDAGDERTKRPDDMASGGGEIPTGRRTTRSQATGSVLRERATADASASTS